MKTKIQIDFENKTISFEESATLSEVLEFISKYIPSEELKDWKISNFPEKTFQPYIPYVQPYNPNDYTAPYWLHCGYTVNSSEFEDIENKVDYCKFHSLLRNEDFKKCRL